MLLAACILLAAVVLHEGGHILAALSARVPVREVGFGLGRVLLSGHVRGTRVTLRAFPVGALVNLDDDAYARLSPGRKAFLALAGPLGNVLGAFAALFGLGLYLGRSLVVGYVFACGVVVALSGAILRAGVQDLVGPVGFVQAVREAGNLTGDAAVVLFAAVSLCLGLVNLAPVPPLDGSRVAMELAGDRVPRRARLALERAGWVIVIALMVLVLAADLIRFARR